MNSSLQHRFSMALAVLLVSTALAPAQTFTTLYSFSGSRDGSNPLFGVIMDQSGTLYGTTSQGGSGYGTVYKLSNGTKTTLYSFSGHDGSYPWAGMVMDKSGALYGTTSSGGASDSGTVFALDSAGVLTTLYSFMDGTDGAEPASGVLLHQGNLYGTTALGGSGYGTVYKVNTKTKKETVLHRFTGSDGSYPRYGSLLMDKAGNLYGTTTYGGGTGCSGYGCGTVWELSATRKETVLYSFTGGSDGSSLFEQSLAIDTEGNLYGTAEQGGADGNGVVFKVNITSKKETVLYSFTGGSDGSIPSSGLLRDRKGNLYATAVGGGGDGLGVVFKVKGTKQTVLHSFGGTDGAYPFTSLLDASGTLYGVTDGGGTYGYGTVFSFKP